MLRIRKATIKDIEVIVDIKIKTWQDTYRALISGDYLDTLASSYSDRVSRRTIMYKKTDRNPFELVAEYDGTVIGFIYFGPARESIGVNSAGCGEIFAVYVLKEFQGCGAGGMLMKTAAALLQGRGFSKLLVWMLEGNPNFRFYKKLGGSPKYKKSVHIGKRGYDEIGYYFKDIKVISAGVALPYWALSIKYNYDIAPYSDETSFIKTGSNCQIFAYNILRFNGFDIPSVWSNELWEDKKFSTKVDEFIPLDIILMTHNDNVWGSHVVLCFGDGMVIHNNKAYGQAHVCFFKDLSKLKTYRVIIGAKRMIILDLVEL